MWMHAASHADRANRTMITGKPHCSRSSESKCQTRNLDDDDYDNNNNNNNNKLPTLTNSLRGAEPLLRSRQLCSYSRTSQDCMGPEGLLLWSLSWARSIQTIPPHPISLKSILTLSTHLRLGLPSGLFLPGFNLYFDISSATVMREPALHKLLTFHVPSPKSHAKFCKY
jgi:hypothetical protein